MKRAEVKKASQKARRNKILQPQKRQNERERPLAFPFLYEMICPKLKMRLFSLGCRPESEEAAGRN